MEPPQKALQNYEGIAQYMILLVSQKKKIDAISLNEETVNILEKKINAYKYANTVWSMVSVYQHLVGIPTSVNNGGYFVEPFL